MKCFTEEPLKNSSNEKVTLINRPNLFLVGWRVNGFENGLHVHVLKDKSVYITFFFSKILVNAMKCFTEEPLKNSSNEIKSWSINFLVMAISIILTITTTDDCFVLLLQHL